MGAAPKIIDKKILQGLVPFNALSPVHFNEVAQKTAVEELRAGRVLFKEGDRDNQSVYLIEGEVTLLDGKDVVGSVTGGSDAARHPLAQQQPRQVGARAKTNVVIARVDSSLLDIMLTWDQSSGYEVAEIDDNEDDDWMTRILQSQAFLKLPPSNIQRLLMSVESVPVKAGSTVIQQGGDGDYFYIIKNGRCMVTRKPAANAKEVKLAELGNGDAFGEDALVSDAKRNATVTMMTDGVLMRLAKKDFVELLKEPLLNKVSYAEAERLVRKGAELLDVRLPGEFDNIHIMGSHNLPLSALRLEASTLDSTAKYIVCCDTGRRSASAAFVLSQRGFEVFVLDEGFSGVPPEALVGESASAASAAAPDSEESPAEVVELKPQREPKADVTPVTAAASAPADTAAADELAQELARIQAEKDDANAARAQAEERVTDLQDELERVRDETREQMQEFEQTLSGLRKENTEYIAELQRLKTDAELQQQSDAVARDQAEALEKEFEQIRAQERSLRSELKTLQTEKSKLESELEQGVQQRVEADTEIAALKARIGDLEPLAEQLKTSAEQIHDLESRLNEAVQSGVQAKSEVGDQLADLRAQLDAALSVRTDLENRLSAAEEAVAAERHAVVDQQQAAGALQEKLAALEGELQAVQEANLAQQARLSELEEERRSEQERLAVVQGTEGELRGALDGKIAELEAATQQRDETKRALEDATARIQALSADSGEQVNKLQAALETANQDMQSVSAERDRLREQNEQHAAELGTIRARVAELEQSEQSLTEARSALDESKASLQSEFDEAQSRLLDASEEMTRLQQALDEAQAAISQEGQEKHAALTALEQERDALRGDLAATREQLERLQEDNASAQGEQQQAVAALQAQLAAVQSQLAEGDATRQALEAQLHDQQAALESGTAALQQERDALATELDAVKSRLGQMEQDQAAGTDATQEAMNALRQELVAAQAQVADADAARQEIEARLSEMSAAAGEAQSQLEQMQQEHAAALAQVRKEAQSGLEKQLRDVRGELEGARAALAREQSQRSNLEEATKAELKARVREVNEQATLELDRLQAALNDSRLQLEEANGQLAAAEDARKATESEIIDVRKAAEVEKKALAAELEQLGMATTADLQAMQKQVQVLQEELNAARKLNAGKPADEELDRLRLLLDEAREEAAVVRSEVEQWREQATAARSDAEQWREEAAAARGDAEQWREQALGKALEDEEQTDELAAMNIQMADIQSRVDDALRLRDEAHKEIEQLRMQVAAAKMAEQSAKPAFVADKEPAPARRGGLWVGMIAGVVFGVLGAGGALWYNQQGNPQGASTTQVPEQPAAKNVAPIVPKASKPEAPPAKPSPPVEKAAEPVVKAAPVRQREFSDELGEGFRGPTMIELPATSYSMGSSVASLDADERPRHEVQLGRFAIGKYEVTFDQFDAFARATGRALVDDKGWGRGSRPVTDVSWDDAVAYTKWLSELTGKRYRLPSEAEWEYAAGGTARSLYWWGNSLGEGRANCFNCGSEWDTRTAAPVGSFSTNALGLHDTAGNVAEWVQDCYHTNYEGAPLDGSAWMSTGCSRRVVRGGGFNSPADSLRTTKRDNQLTNTRSDDIGFRIARDM